MYNWRKMTPEQRDYVLELRKLERRPWHGPPHRIGETTLYHVTAANYEHKAIIGTNPERLAEFENKLLDSVSSQDGSILAWCLLPNHYHILLDTPNVLNVLAGLGRLHGSTSHGWNLEDKTVGRTCWHRAVERGMRTERHYWVTLNYIHHNPVHHGYVSRWQEWPFSSAAKYLENVGADVARQRWQEYPLLDYGKGWDDPAV